MQSKMHKHQQTETRKMDKLDALVIKRVRTKEERITIPEEAWMEEVQ